jgi:nucleoside-diphosphate-sugar epimerase
MNVFLLGAGYSARAYARLVAGEADRIAGTTRSMDKAAALRDAGIAPVIFDGSTMTDDMAGALREATHLVVSAAPGLTPGAVADPLLRLLPGGLREAMPALRWAGYLSTVGVYGDHQGDWVEEEAELRPKSSRAVARVAAEREWLDAGAAAGIPVAVLRLAGIYGPGRNALANLAAGTARRTVKPGQVFNRIHVDDIAGALAFLGRNQTGGVFNVTDDEPGPPQDVVAFAATLSGVEPPPEVPYEEAEMSPMARSFWSDNKRVSNAKLRAAGYRFVHPDYRHALAAMWRDGSWKGDGAAQGGEG